MTVKRIRYVVLVLLAAMLLAAIAVGCGRPAGQSTPPVHTPDLPKEEIPNNSAPIQTISFEAEILEIADNAKHLTVLVNGKESSILITRDLEIFDLDGTQITAADLAVGQTIEVVADNEVIYEPIETYGSCHVIRVIRETEKADDPTQITVQADGPLAAAEAFVERYGAERVNWPADHIYAVSDFKLLDWGIDEVSTDGTAVVGWMKYALLPDGNYDNFMVGGIMDGTGEWEGWVIDRKGFMLVLQADGRWHCVEWGGGMGPGTLEYHGYTAEAQ